MMIDQQEKQTNIRDIYKTYQYESNSKHANNEYMPSACAREKCV